MTTILFSSILAWLVAQPWTPADKLAETVESRHERLTTIAQSVAENAKGDRLRAAFELIHFREETHFDYSVQECVCKRYQCDPLKTRDGIYHRAHSLAQAHHQPSWSIADWWSLCNTTREAVDANVLFVGRFYYRNHLSCGYARLAGIRTGCDDPKSTRRAAMAVALSKRL